MKKMEDYLEDISECKRLLKDSMTEKERRFRFMYVTETLYLIVWLAFLLMVWRHML